MKLQKKLFILAVLLMAASMVFAQTSMTSHSTQKLFGTDVDDFMNVNEWQNVKPKNIFGFLGYGDDGTKAINFGLAHQFKPFYLGTYFEGQLNKWQHDKNKTIPGTTTNESKTNHTAKGELLFGFGNIGVMTDISYKPKSNNKTTLTGDTKTIDDKFTLDVNLIAGVNLNSNNKLYKIYAAMGLDSDVNNETVYKDGKFDSFIAGTLTGVTWSDISNYTLKIDAGFSHDFSSKDSLTQTVAADLNTKWLIQPKTVKKYVSGGTTYYTYFGHNLDNTITITPKYQVAYEPEGKFAFKAEAGLETGFNFTAGYNYVQNTRTQAKPYYYKDRTYTNTIDIKPSVKAAFVYAPVSKFKMNFGLGFNVPSVNWEFNSTQERDTDTGKVIKTKNKNNVLTFNTANGKFTASSGFTWLITENLTLDANWDIINTLLKGTGTTADFGTHFATSTGWNDFWNNLNNLVFHNISFAASLKF